VRDGKSRIVRVGSRRVRVSSTVLRFGGAVVAGGSLAVVTGLVFSGVVHGGELHHLWLQTPHQVQKAARSTLQGAAFRQGMQMVRGKRLSKKGLGDLHKMTAKQRLARYALLPVFLAAGTAGTFAVLFPAHLLLSNAILNAHWEQWGLGYGLRAGASICRRPMREAKYYKQVVSGKVPAPSQYGIR
jgi:hypothetical protein